MRLTFRRVTSSGRFIPEIDGLRFIAILSVVLYHYDGFLRVKDKHTYDAGIDWSGLSLWLSHGSFGVPLFFSISGFILGAPFARHALAGGKPIDLQAYFLRRLTRLEPPYILAMTVLLAGAVLVSRTLPWRDALISYVCSLCYIHNFVFPGTLPSLNCVAWSLEVEVQFYVLAPLLAGLFRLPSNLWRRLSFLATAAVTLTVSHLIDLPFISLINYLHFFLAGFLLADLSVSQSRLLPVTRLDWLAGILSLLLMVIFEKDGLGSSQRGFTAELLQLTGIFFLCYYVLCHGIFHGLRWTWITNIGGMCYSIYLLHYAVISLFGNVLVRYSFSRIEAVNIAAYTVCLTVPMVVICSAFYLLVERPCMNPDWSRNLLAWLSARWRRHAAGREDFAVTCAIK